MQKRYAVLLLILILIDLTSKYYLLLFAELNSVVLRISDSFYFYYTFNESAMGMALKSVSKFNAFYISGLSVIYIISGLLILKLHKLDWANWKKVLTFIGVYYSLLLILTFTRDSFSIVLGNSYWPVLLGRITSLFMVITFFYSLSEPFLKTIAVFLLAAGAGNTLSMILPPFKIIDFIYSADLTGIFSLGVFNIADLYFYIFEILLLIYIGYRIFWKFKRKKITAVEPCTEELVEETEN